MHGLTGKEPEPVAMPGTPGIMPLEGTPMGTPTTDYDLLLSAPSPVEAALAENLLAEHGIPSFSHGVDRDLAELGAGVHVAFTRPNLYVPKGTRERALAILAEAWDTEPLPDAGPSAPSDANDPEWSSDAETAPGVSEVDTSWTPFLALLAAAILVVVLWMFVKS